MTSTKEKTPLNVFTCLGVDMEKSDDQMAKGTCPFCDKANHFFVRYAGKKKKPDGKWSAPGHWMCQSCQMSGGVLTFLKELITASDSLTTKEDRLELWRKKKIPPAICRVANVCKSSITGNWLIPTYGWDGEKLKITNIHRWWEAKNRVLGCDTLATDLLGRQFLSKDNTRPLWIVEGHWDWLIGEHIFRSLGKRDEVDIIGSPGAGSFRWPELLQSRPEVIVPFDNDHPKVNEKTGKTTQAGLDGIKKIAAMAADLEHPPASLKYVLWPEDFPDGFDLRDLYISNL